MSGWTIFSLEWLETKSWELVYWYSMVLTIFWQKCDKIFWVALINLVFLDNLNDIPMFITWEQSPFVSGLSFWDETYGYLHGKKWSLKWFHLL